VDARHGQDLGDHPDEGNPDVGGLRVHLGSSRWHRCDGSQSSQQPVQLEVNPEEGALHRAFSFFATFTRLVMEYPFPTRRNHEHPEQDERDHALEHVRAVREVRRYRHPVHRARHRPGVHRDVVPDRRDPGSPVLTQQRQRF
jgi:hypothetical protein